MIEFPLVIELVEEEEGETTENEEIGAKSNSTETE